MLDSEVLYYPNFEPSKKWFRSYLLFFDTVCSIIPEDYDIELLSESTLYNVTPDILATCMGLTRREHKTQF